MRLRLLYSRLRVICFIAFVVAVTAACQGPPPTMFVLVVTATPESGTAAASSALDQTPAPLASATPTITPTVDPFPTPTISQILVAEQRFQHGRMFWLDPVTQIWVMVATDADQTEGIWTVYNDTFVDGQPEFDPTIVPPEGLFQPERGFGKLWRENPEVRQAVGWALEPEYGHVTRYEYHPGGTVNAQNEYIKGPGYHILYSLNGQAYRFDEANGTWRLVG